MQNLETQLLEVQKFLVSERNDVRLHATEIIASCSSDSQLHPFFTKLNIGSQLLPLMADINQKISHNACLAMVNLSSNPNFVLNLLDSYPFNIILKHLRSYSSSSTNTASTVKKIELMIKMLVNLTQSEDGQSELLQEKTPLQGLHVIRLIHILKKVDLSDIQCLQVYHYLPHVLCNVTRSAVGRYLIMEPERNLVRYIIAFLDEYAFDFKKKQKSTENEIESETLSISHMYQIFHRGIWETMRNCIWILNDSPNLLLKSLLANKSHQKTDNVVECQTSNKISNNVNDSKLEDDDGNCNQSEEEKVILNDFILRIFLDVGINDDWRKNCLIYEILNPILGSILEYKSKVRKKLRHQSLLMERYMGFDKLRFEDANVHRICLECLHLMVGLKQTSFDLHSNITRYLDGLKLKELLEEYEVWQTDENLIEISKNVRYTHAFQMKPKNEKKESENVDEDTKECKVDDEETNEEDKSDMKFEPMGHEMHKVKAKPRRTYNEEESNALVDLFIDNSSTKGNLNNDQND